jgi:Flp pilus assembly protein TadB
MTAATDQVDAHRDELEEETALGLEILVRGAEVGLAVFIGLLVSPPLAILVVVVAVPLLAFALVAGVLAAIVAIPYLLFRTVREHHRTHRSSAVVHGLRRLRARAA